MTSVRIEYRRIALVYLVTIAGPLLLGLIAEFFFEASFSLVLLAAFVSIPIAVFFVCRTAIAEMERVVQIVAPYEVEESEPPSSALPDLKPTGGTMSDGQARAGALDAQQQSFFYSSEHRRGPNPGDQPLSDPDFSKQSSAPNHSSA